MTGSENYNYNFDEMSKKRIKNNPDKAFLNGFYDYLLVDTSYSGAYGYLGNVINFIDTVNVTDPAKITLQNYTSYLASIKTKTSSYRIMVYSSLKKFSSYLKANGYTDDYMQYVKRPKFKESSKTKKKREKGFMTEEEVKILLDAIRTGNKDDCWKTRDMAIALLLFNTGIRCSALYKLDLEDISFEDKTITVLEKGELTREISISDNTIDMVKKWLYYRNEIMKTKYDPALFVSNHKKRISEKSIYNMIKEYGTDIVDKNITPHKTRATFGTQLYNKTHDLYFVQSCMGHANPKTTEIYIRGQGNNISKTASDLMNEFIN